MQHDEFVDAYRRGAIEVDVDRSKALQIANAWEKLPHEFRSAHVFWSAAWLLTIPAATLVAFLHTWWAGVLILLIATPTLFNAAKRSAALHVRDYAVESAFFYSYAMENGIIRIREKA